jgi:small subunit ribosomal protein S4
LARYTGSVCRLCRREGMKLFLKGDRCYGDKCAFERHTYPPGQHAGARRRKSSDYGIMLREKQKVKRMYGLMEKQFKACFQIAERQNGITGINLLILLERRLDNVVYRLGFAESRSQARQYVSHKHFTVNGRNVNIPSYLVKVGDIIALKEKGKKVVQIQESLEAVARRGVPAWLELNKEGFVGDIKSFPTREDLTMPIQEQLIVEYYSK